MSDTCNGQDKAPLVAEGNTPKIHIVLTITPDGGDKTAGAEMEFETGNPLDCMLGGLQIFENVVREVFGDKATDKAIATLNTAIVDAAVE